MLAILTMLVRQGALRVAPGGSAPPISFVARRGLGAARSGRESRLADRTGKLDLRCCCLDQHVALWIEDDGGCRCPVSGRTTPTSWVAFSRLVVERMTRHQHAAILTGMTLSRRDVANATVPVLVIVPAHEACHPLPGGAQLGEPPSGNSGRYFAVRNSASTKALSSLTRGRE